MPEPKIVQVVRDFRAQLLAREPAQVAEMARRWAQAEAALDNSIALLSQQIYELERADEAVSLHKIRQMERYQSLLAQVERQTRRFTDAMDNAIGTWTQLALELGLEGSQAALATVISGFNVLNVGAVETMAGMTSGGPLKDLLAKAWPATAQTLEQTLVRSMVLGRNPTKTAQAMRQALAEPLNRALTVARTEQLRAYREASRQQYTESGVVGGYQRVCAKDMRVCMACLLLDGKLYPLDVPFEAHPNCRCTLVPQVRGLPDITWLTGRAWFESLSADKQKALMGNGHYQAWQAGKFELGQMVTIKTNDTWGNSPQVTPLGVLTK